MNPRPSFLLASLAATFLAAAPAQAVIFLVDPSTTAGTSPTFSSGPSQPYPVATTDLWNSGIDSSFGSGVFADGTPATGVTVVTDQLPSTGTTEYNFATSPETHAIGQTSMGGVFNTNPTNNSMYGNNVTALGHGGVAMKITGLPSGTYGTANDLLENSTNASWVQGDNYSKITVNLDAANPDLIIISEGIAGGTETRGWLSSVQIIPEPSSFLLAAASAVGLVTRRRRVA